METEILTELKGKGKTQPVFEGLDVRAELLAALEMELSEKRR
jgi:hypothetical protein